jgi:hypothetical protein
VLDVSSGVAVLGNVVFGASAIVLLAVAARRLKSQPPSTAATRSRPREAPAGGFQRQHR